MKKIHGVLAGILATLAVVSFAFAADPLMINGAGATFPYPLYSKWFYEYSNANPGVKFNYQSIGSGGGIKQITAGTVDFGATDAPMTEEELRKLPGAILHIPTAMGAVVVGVQPRQGVDRPEAHSRTSSPRSSSGRSPGGTTRRSRSRTRP